MLTVYTARVTYAGPYRLDVTRGGADPIGVAFAPTWAILRPALAGMTAGDPSAWPTYVPQYTAEMRISAGMDEAHPRFGPLERAAWARGVRPRLDAWREVEARGQVVLVCFCVDAERCHRRPLAGFFVKRGAVDGGELVHAERCDPTARGTSRSSSGRARGGSRACEPPRRM